MGVDGVELIGYVASALVVVSLAMRSVVRLRIVSLVGSVVFVVYGAAIESVPIVVTNATIAVLNVWFLRAELGGRRDLGARLISTDNPFLRDFVDFHLADIRRYQPDFVMPDAPAAAPGLAVLLLRDGLPAGVLIGAFDERTGDLTVRADYVLRAYRDSRLGSWLFGPGARVLRDAGVRRVVSGPGNDIHRGYLTRVGFRRDGDRYVRDLA